MSTWPNRGASGGPCGGLEDEGTQQPKQSDHVGLTQANRPPRKPVWFRQTLGAVPESRAAARQHGFASLGRAEQPATRSRRPEGRQVPRQRVGDEVGSSLELRKSLSKSIDSHLACDRNLTRLQKADEFNNSGECDERSSLVNHTPVDGDPERRLLCSAGATASRGRAANTLQSA